VRLVSPTYLKKMRLFLAVLWWFAACFTLLLGAWWACQGEHCAPDPFDHGGMAWAATWRDDALDLFMRGITWLGSLWLLLPLTVWLAWRWGRRGMRQEAAFLLLALPTASALCHLVKLLVDRPRPDLFAALIPMPFDGSFPSAHTMQVTVVAVAIGLVAARRWWPALAMGVLSVGLSRIYLQVHYPSDVLAGLLAGLCWVMGLHALMFGTRPRDQRHP